MLNEYPQRASAPGSIFISPAPEGEYEGRVKGKRLEVRFKKPLPANQTVVITFGTGLKDQVGNPMSEPFVLAFSTGDTLDQASIEGDIIGLENPAATWVWAYPLDSCETDTSGFANPDPAKDKAPFASQPDDQGHFRLTYLPTTSFRVFAVAEVRPDRLWQHQTEALAVASQDVRAALENPPFLNLWMNLRDLTPPRLIGAETTHRQGMRLSFNEPIAVTGARVEIKSETGQALSVIYMYQNPADSAAVYLTTAIQREGDEYTVRLDSLPDRSGNVGDSLVTEITASAQPDTIGPRFSWSRPSRGDSEVDPRASLRLGFTEAVTLTDLPQAVHIADTSGAEIVGTWKYSYPALCEFVPSSPLAAGMDYRIAIWGDSLHDIFGVPSPDSLSSIVFRTLIPDQLGSITGQVAREASDLPFRGGALCVVADRLEPPGGSWEAPLGNDGSYRLDSLPGADYRLWLYQDLDHNRHWSPGKTQPFMFAEPFAIVRDSVRVRPGWETEGVDISWPSP